uniref:Uncharacterized protein n=1 Tax=Knipowitschia caucasica TaxID=637954 RepID=A0AAV2K4P1_KNICA
MDFTALIIDSEMIPHMFFSAWSGSGPCAEATAVMRSDAFRAAAFETNCSVFVTSSGILAVITDLHTCAVMQTPVQSLLSHYLPSPPLSSPALSSALQGQLEGSPSEAVSTKQFWVSGAGVKRRAGPPLLYALAGRPDPTALLLFNNVPLSADALPTVPALTAAALMSQFQLLSASCQAVGTAGIHDCTGQVM